MIVDLLHTRGNESVDGHILQGMAIVFQIFLFKKNIITFTQRKFVRESRKLFISLVVLRL